MTVVLRDYQEKAVDDIRAAMRAHRRVLFQLVTGGGKTIIFSYVTNGAVQKQKRVYIFAHRAEILRQISVAIGRYGMHHGWIAPGRTPTNDLCQVGMIQTAARRLDKLPPPDIIVIDEAHHCAAGQYEAILAAWPSAYVLGVTATPLRLDRKGLGKHFDIMVLGPPCRELIDRGFLAPFVYLAPELANFDNVKKRMGDYVNEAIAEIMDKPTITGSAIEHYKTYLPGKTAIAFCISVEHAKNVAEQFSNAGIPAASIDGKMEVTERQAVCRALETGDIKVLTSCELISEGFDAPSVNGAILLRPTASLAMKLQQDGRVLRVKPDGSPAIILDHVGNFHRHGLPDAPRDWTLDGCDKKKKEFKTQKCKACFRVFAVEKNWRSNIKCDQRDDADCLLHVSAKDTFMGEGRTVEHVDGQLSVITDSPAWAGGISISRAAGPEYKAMLVMADTREKLLEIAKFRGYNRRWVFHVLKSRGYYNEAPE
jgi:superfamily II DNA or RNA helicase